MCGQHTRGPGKRKFISTLALNVFSHLPISARFSSVHALTPSLTSFTHLYILTVSPMQWDPQDFFLTWFQWGTNFYVGRFCNLNYWLWSLLHCPSWNPSFAYFILYHFATKIFNLQKMYLTRSFHGKVLVWYDHPRGGMEVVAEKCARLPTHKVRCAKVQSEVLRWLFVCGDFFVNRDFISLSFFLEYNRVYTVEIGRNTLFILKIHQSIEAELQGNIRCSTHLHR